MVSLPEPLGIAIRSHSWWSVWQNLRSIYSPGRFVFAGIEVLRLRWCGSLVRRALNYLNRATSTHCALSWLENQFSWIRRLQV